MNALKFVVTVAMSVLEVVLVQVLVSDWIKEPFSVYGAALITVALWVLTRVLGVALNDGMVGWALLAATGMTIALSGWLNVFIVGAFASGAVITYWQGLTLVLMLWVLFYIEGSIPKWLDS